MRVVPAKNSKKGTGHATPRRALLPATRGRDGVGANDSPSAPHPSTRPPSCVPSPLPPPHGRTPHTAHRRSGLRRAALVAKTL